MAEEAIFSRCGGDGVEGSMVLPIPGRVATHLTMGNSEIPSFVGLETARIHKQMYNIRRWHGYSGIGVSPVRGWYGEFGEFVADMAIREWLTRVELAMPFTNVCE